MFKEGTFNIAVSLLILHILIYLIWRYRPNSNPDCSYMENSTNIDLYSEKRSTANNKESNFSQFGQDIWVIERTNFKKNGYYIDIGANDGKHWNNTYLLDTKYKWNGLCIDPILRNMEERSCHEYKGLVSNKIEAVTFVFSADPGGGLSGIDGKNMAHANSPHILNGNRKKMKTEITQNVFNKFNVPYYVDYLSLDVEGAEMMVLEGIDFDRHRFGIISIEHNYQKTMKENIAHFLISKGYKYDTTLGVDDIYIHDGEDLKEGSEEWKNTIIEIMNPIDNKPMLWFNNFFTKNNFPGPLYQSKQKKNSLHYILKSRKGVLDIGAHIGDYGIPLAKALKNMNVTDIPVYCIDPSPDKCEFMRNVRKLNNLTEKEVKIICSGLSDKEEIFTYQTEGINNENKNNTGGFQWHPAKNGQRFTTLDDLWKKRIVDEIGFFWLDAQWMEPQILRGGKRFLKKCKPYILIEYDPIIEYHQDNRIVKSWKENGSFESFKTDPTFKDLFNDFDVSFVSHQPFFDDILIKLT